MYRRAPPHCATGLAAVLKQAKLDNPSLSKCAPQKSIEDMEKAGAATFGTDYPYHTAADHVKGLLAAFGPEELQAIERENALRILPRLKTA